MSEAFTALQVKMVKTTHSSPTALNQQCFFFFLCYKKVVKRLAGFDCQFYNTAKHYKQHYDAIWSISFEWFYHNCFFFNLKHFPFYLSYVPEPGMNRYHIQWMPEYCHHNETRGPEKSSTQVCIHRPCLTFYEICFGKVPDSDFWLWRVSVPITWNIPHAPKIHIH